MTSTTHAEAAALHSLPSRRETTSMDSLPAHTFADTKSLKGRASSSATSTGRGSADHTSQLRDSGIDALGHTRVEGARRSSSRVTVHGEVSMLHSTPTGKQPLPPSLLTTRLTPSPCMGWSTTAVWEGGGRAAGCRSSSPNPMHIFVPSMGTPPQQSHTPRSQSTLDGHRNNSSSRSQGRRLDPRVQPQRNCSQRSRGEEMSSEALYRRVCSRRGSVLGDVAGMPRSALVPDETRRKSPSGSSSRESTPMVSRCSSSPVAVPNNGHKGTDNTATVYGGSASRDSRIGSTAPTLRASFASGSVDESATPPIVSSGYLPMKTMAVTSPLAPRREDASHRMRQQLRLRSGLSHNELYAAPSSTSNTSLETLSSAERSLRTKSSSLANRDAGVSSSMRSISNRRVHFVFDDETGCELKSTDSVAMASFQSRERTWSPKVLHQVTTSSTTTATTTTLPPAPCDANLKLASPASKSGAKFPNHAGGESVHERQQNVFQISESTTCSVSSLQFPHGPESSSARRSGSSVLSLRLNKKDGRVEAVPIFAMTRCSGGGSSSSTKAAAEGGGVSVASPLSASSSIPASRSAISISSLDPSRNATYQPRYPLPKPALKLISRYGDDRSADRGYVDATHLKEGSDQKPWWQSIESTASSLRPSSKKAVDQGFTGYVWDFLSSQQQWRARCAGVLDTASGRCEDTGGLSAAWTSSSSSPARPAGGPSRRVEVLLKWLLLGVVALASIFLILVSMTD